MINFKDSEEFGDNLIRMFPNDFTALTDEKHKYGSKTITFQVTDDCNLCCSYCYQQNKGHHKMPFEVAKKFIDKLLTNDKSITYYISNKDALGVILEFIGGEPFLEVDLIDQIIDYFMEQCILLNHPWINKFRISICSNGVLYFTPKVQEFIRKHNTHLSFSISIDGNKELHDACRIFPDGTGSYDLAIKAVKHYRQNYQQSIGSKMTLSPNNIKYTSDAIINLFKNGYTYIFTNCVYEKGWTIEHASILYNELKKVADYLLNNNLEYKQGTAILNMDLNQQKSTSTENYCGGNGNMLAIDYKGDLYPCLRYMESSIGNDQLPYIIGNLNNGIGYNQQTKDKVAELNVTYQSQSPQECLDCPVSIECGWCSALNYQEFGTINKRTTYTCLMHKARVLANYYYQNKIAKKYGLEKILFLMNKQDSINIIGLNETNYLMELANE